MKCNETAQSSKVHLFFPFGLPRAIPSPHGTCTPWDIPLQPSELQVLPQQILLSFRCLCKGLTHKLAGPYHHHHPFSSLAPAKSSPVSISSCKVSACPQHLQPSGIFCYIPPHQITIVVLSTVQSLSSTDRVKLKVPMILESCKVIMKGSRKKPATLRDMKALLREERHVN